MLSRCFQGLLTVGKGGRAPLTEYEPERLVFEAGGLGGRRGLGDFSVRHHSVDSTALFGKGGE